MLSRHRPQTGEGDEQQRIHQDGIGHGEKAGRARAEHQGRHGDEGIGGVEITAQKKPCHPGAEAAATQAPFIQLRKVAGAPARRDETKTGDQREQAKENRQRDGIGLHGHLRLLSWYR
jgi:hypothetical protein